MITSLIKELSYILCWQVAAALPIPKGRVWCRHYWVSLQEKHDPIASGGSLF